MPNRRVLIIAYYFPPILGGGTFRPLKFAKYLPEFGWDPIVLCAQPGPEHDLDPELLEELPPSVVVERVGHLRPKQMEDAWLQVWNLLWKLRLRRLAGRLEPYKVLRWIPLDPYITWVVPAYRAARRLIRQYRPDVVMTSSPPHSLQLVGLWLKQTTHLPWVADFRDPWTGNRLSPMPSHIHETINLRSERRVVRLADWIVVVTSEMMESFRRTTGQETLQKCITISNGFDPADFATPPMSRDDQNTFRIVYPGTLYGLRNADAFLNCIDKLVATGQVRSEHLRVEFIGRDGTGAAERLKGRSWFFSQAPVSHRDAVRWMQRASSLLLLVPPEAAYAHSGKLFEYLGAARPILAVVPPESEAARLVEAAGAGIVAAADDEAAIASAILTLYERWRQGRLEVKPNQDVVAGFDRRLLTRSLADLLERTLDATAGVAAADHPSKTSPLD